MRVAAISFVVLSCFAQVVIITGRYGRRNNVHRENTPKWLVDKRLAHFSVQKVTTRFQAFLVGFHFGVVERFSHMLFGSAGSWTAVRSTQTRSDHKMRYVRTNLKR